MQEWPDRETSRNTQLEVRKPGCYQYDDTLFEANSGKIVRMFTTAILIPPPWEQGFILLLCVS
jgi:hypothetical protein